MDKNYFFMFIIEQYYLTLSIINFKRGAEVSAVVAGRPTMYEAPCLIFNITVQRDS